MSKYTLCACSTVDIDKKYLDESGIGIVNFQFILDGKSNKDDFGSNISFKEFYDMMRKGAKPTSSQPSPDAYLETWEKYLSDGSDILHITLSSGISGAYNSALIAKDLASEKYPDRKIIVIDDNIAYTGGMNIGDEYANIINKYGDFKDTAIKITGNAVNSFKIMFLSLFYYREKNIMIILYINNKRIFL